ncbi:MAG TPA: SPOR domain-containing protein [Burkholderiales bacterium]
MGAVALVLAAVIVLPMVFDPEPKSTLPPVSVKIPGENEAPAFAPKPPPVKPAAPQPEPAATQPAAPAAPPPAEKEQAKKEQAKKEPVNAGYVIQVGAFAKPDTVLAKLAAAKLPYYTEPASGNLVRVRAGPFASREAADKAVAKLKQLGFKPGAVSSKSG